MIGELRVEQAEGTVGAAGSEEGVVDGFDLRARHVLGLLDIGGAVFAGGEADELGVADDAATGDGDLLGGVGELKAVEVDDGVVERSDVAVEEGLSAELAVDAGVAGDDAEDSGVLREDEVIVKVDGFGKDACDGRADVQVSRVRDADAEWDADGESGLRRLESMG